MLSSPPASLLTPKSGAGLCGKPHLGWPGSGQGHLRPWSWWRQWLAFSANAWAAWGNKGTDERWQQPGSGSWSLVVPSTTAGLDRGPLQDLSHGYPTWSSALL